MCVGGGGGNSIVLCPGVCGGVFIFLVLSNLFPVHCGALYK